MIRSPRRFLGLKRPKGSPGSLTIAVATAAVLLVVAGGTYRVLAGRLGRTAGVAPLPPGTLDTLSMEIGNWVGSDAPMDAAVIRATDSDAHVSRTYERWGRAVGLFIAYGVRTRDLTPHRPEVCYPGAGWTLQGKEARRIDTGDNGQMDCTLYRFSRSGTDVRSVTILNYYIIDGRPCPDVSAVRAKAWRGAAGMRYLAQVQITCPGGAFVDDKQAEAAVAGFATEAACQIANLFPDCERDAP